jgi:hypothetical protein
LLKRSLLQKIVSWLAVTLGCIAGFVACALVGMAPIPQPDGSPAWYLQWFALVGLALLGLGFLVCSLVAIRNRGRRE